MKRRPKQEKKVLPTILVSQAPVITEEHETPLRVAPTAPVAPPSERSLVRAKLYKKFMSLIEARHALPIDTEFSKTRTIIKRKQSDEAQGID